jgi:hypothetical protein
MLHALPRSPAILAATGLAFLLGLPIHARAQTGVVRGTLRTGGAPVAGGQVFLANTRWAAMTDSAGRYAIIGVPPGNYSLRARAIGMSPVEVVAVHVAADSSTLVDVVMEDRETVHLDRLPLLPRCRALGRTLGPDSTDQLYAALLCATIAITTSEEPAPPAVCLAIGGGVSDLGTDPSPRIISALAELTPTVYPMSACQRVNDPRPYRVRSTGAYAWRIYVERVQVTGSQHAQADLAYDVGMLWAAGWTCSFERGPSGWYPTTCRMVWQS